ncbi:MAG: reverse transcriptase domain-containing protein [Candidatus Omnitrophica bacterium]|nr:reverse transcriptase domain-containing protein [Candidatus Omnitrophota bacterium]
MKTFRNLYPEIYTFKNLYAAFLKAKKYKRQSRDALEFEYYLERNLFRLQDELKELTFLPRRPKKLIVYEPVKRIISCPSFRDRVIQQALLQVIASIFECSFIYDSYAFRVGKGTHSALKRFDSFKRRTAPRRFPNGGFILKADIKSYYPCVDHAVLISLIEKKIKDSQVIGLIKRFLENHSLGGKGICVGGPLSQLFANIYLSELDYYVKGILKEKFYLRYCDDFFVLKKKRESLEKVKAQIEAFLKQRLCLELNKDKTGITTSNKGVDLLGYKSFYFYRLLRKRNVRSFKKRVSYWQEQFKENKISLRDITRSIRGWIEYAKYADSYKLRKKLFRVNLFTRMTEVKKNKRELP